MKIGIFTEVYKPIINGVVNSIIGFKTGLEELGHEVYIFCPTYKHHQDDPTDKHIVHCKSLALPGKSGYHYIYPLDQQTMAIASQMDIIHVQHPFIMGRRAAKVAETFNIPIIFTNHTQYDQYTHYIPLPSQTSKKIIINYLKQFAKQLDLIIAPAPGIKHKLESYKITTPIEIVPNGIDVNRFSKTISKKITDKIKRQLKIDPNDKVLIYTGRIAEEKNLTFLIEAFKKVLTKKPQTTLLLVGGGMELDKFNNLITKEKLNNKAIITDFIPYEFIQNYLALAKIYVTASKSEVHPLTLLEAMAQGLPCVIVNAPGTGDIVTNNKDGLATSNSLIDYSNAIIKLLDNQKLYDRLSVEATKTAANYSFLKTSEILLKAYSKVINTHKLKKPNTKS